MNKSTVLLLFLFCSSLWAAKDKIDSRGTSEIYRQDKDFSLTAQIFGHGPAASVMQGLHLGFFIDPDSLITVELVSGENPLIWSSSGFTIKSFSASTHFKRFFGNTFYLKAGLDYKRVDYRYEDSFFGSSYEKTSFIGNSFALGASLGNQWQWSVFTFGFDWIGISMPFVSQLESSSSIGTSPNQQRLDRDQTRYLKDNILVFMHAYLGASF